MVARPLTRNALRSRSARDIVDAIADAARAWSDPDFPTRQQCAKAIEERTGYSTPVVCFALDQLFAPITRDALTAAIRDELGSVDALDRFVQRTGRPDAFAASVGDVCVIASRTTIGVALLPAIYALCAKCDVTVKDREDNLVASFFKTLAEGDEAFAGAARAHAFSSSDRSALGLQRFACIVAFGKDEALENIRNVCDPGSRFIGFGSRASAGYISAAAARDDRLLDTLLSSAANDVALYETEGCMSLHMLFVEGTDAPSVAKRLAGALRAVSGTFPAGARDGFSIARFSQVRDTAVFAASQNGGAVFAGDDYAVMLATGDATPPPFASRCIGVLPVEGPGAALRYLKTHAIALEAFALSEARDDIVQMAVDGGAVRLTQFGKLQCPPPAGNHGGRPRIVDFIRWVEREI